MRRGPAGAWLLCCLLLFLNNTQCRGAGGLREAASHDSKHGPNAFMHQHPHQQAGGHRHSSTHAAHVLQQLKHEHQRAHKTRSRRSRAPGSKRQQWQAWLAGELDFAGLGLDPDMQLGPAVPHAAQGLQTLPSPAGAHQQMVPPDQSASEPAAPQPEAWETPHPTRHEHQHAPVDVTQQPSPSESWDQSIHIDAEAAAGIEFEVEEEIEYDESSPMSHASLQQTARMAPMPSRTPPAGDTTAPTPTHVDGDHQEYDYEYVYEEVDAQALAEDIKSNTPAGPSRSPPPAPAPSYDTARKVVIKLPSDGQLFTGPQQHPPPTASQGGVKPPPPPPPPPPLKVPPPSQGPPTLVSTPIKGPAPSDTVKRALTDTVTSPPAAPAPTAPPLQAKHSPAPLPPALPVKQPAARNNTFGSPGPRNIGKDNPKPREQPVGYGDYGSYWGYGGAAPREQHPAGSGGHGSAKHSKQPVGYGGVGEYWGKGGYGGMDSKNRKPPAPAPPPKGLLSPPPPKSVADTSPASGSGGQEAPQAGGKQGAGSKQEPGQAPSKEAPVGSWKPPGPRGKEQQGVDDRAKDTPRTPRDSSDDGFDSGISEPAAGVGDGEFEEEGLDPGVLPPSVGDDYDDDAASPPVGGWPTTPPESSDADAGLVPASGCKAGTPTDVVGSALVIEDSTTSTGQALRAVADCVLEGLNTYQYGGDCELYCTEAADYAIVQMVRLSIKTGGSGQTVCSAVRHNTKIKMAGICSIIPVANCCEPVAVAVTA